MKIGILENGDKSIYHKIISTFLIVCSLLCFVTIGLSQQRGISKRTKLDYRLYMKGYTFDPLKAEPYIPVKLRITEVPKEPTYYIIQFTKSLTREERTQIQSKYGLHLTNYIPHFAFLEKLSPQTLDLLSKNPLFRAKVIYHPAFKISPGIGKLKFRTQERKSIKGLLLRALLFPDAELDEVVETLKKKGASGIKALDDRKIGGLVQIRFILLSKNLLPEIAKIKEVRWIEEVPESFDDNGITAGTMQSGTPGVTPIWFQGIQGEGQIIGIMDSTPIDMNHCFFEDPVDNTIRLAHRKVVGHRDSSGMAAGYHSNFVAGIAAGDDFNLSGTAPDRGNAWASRITFGNRRDVTEGRVSMFSYLSSAANDGAFIHSNSWHQEPNPQYNQTAADVDTFIWNNESHLVLGSSGNTGEAIGPPGTAKDALCVSATRRDPNEMNFGDGNDGPTPDGRRKPDLMAPGCNITSSDVSTACGTRLRGCATSWATPAASAAATLIRQYYTEGWYPSGTQQPHHAFVPSGALLKATLLNSTINMTGIAGYPSDREGWGIIRFDRVLFFPGSARNLRVWGYRNVDGLYTGHSRTHHVDIDTNAQPLQVTLVWTDPPASAGSVSPMVNDLDLSVTTPDGTQTFLGNHFVGGVSATGGAADMDNNVEMVLINNPAPGDWTITVTGTEVNVGNPGQGYALVVTVDMSESPIPTGNQDTLVVRVMFSDIAYEPPLPNLQNKMADVVDYFDEVTYGQATILPDYRGPIALDHNKDYYYHPSRNLLIEMTQEVVDKLVVAEPDVFTKGTANPADDIDRLILVTNDINFTEDWATTGPWPYDMPGGFTRPISVSIQSYDNSVARFTHGLGHQFSLVDLYAHPGVVFPRSYVDEWDNMAGLFNKAHFLVWSKERAEWITSHGSSIRYVPRPAAGTNYNNTFQLFLQESTATNRKGIAIGITEGAATLNDEDVFYFVEARDNTLGGYDDVLPGSGVLIYYVNERIPQGEGPVILVDKNLTTMHVQDAAFAVADTHALPGTGITITVHAGTGGADYDIEVDYTPPVTDYNVFITKGDTIDGNFYSYFSPDIWVDSPKNGWNLGGGPPPNDQTEDPVIGMDNRIYARIHNNGPGTSFDFDVQFRISEPYHTVGGAADFNKFVDIKHIDSLDQDGSPGAPRILYAEWTPEDDGDPHSCVLVEIINLKGNDTNPHDNIAQENLREVTSITSSPYSPVTYSYTLKNSFDREALFYFRAQGVPLGWQVDLVPRKILLNPGERMSGVATITPPPDAEVCTSESIQITSWTPRGDTIIPVGGGIVQVDLRRPVVLTLDAGIEGCRGKDRKLLAEAITIVDCYRITARGCTDPPQPNQEIIVKFTDPNGNPIYHTVMTDEHGCFEDFIVNAQGGIWQVEAEYPGDDCDGPADSPTGTVLVPPRVPTPVPGLWYSFHLGINFPTGSFSNSYDPGPSLTFDLEYRFLDNISLLALIGFHYFHGKDNDLYWRNLSVNLKMYFPLLGWRWYINGGGGIYYPNIGSNKAGINLGTGLNFPIDQRLSLDIGADYHIVDLGGNNRYFIDIKMGIIFRF